MSAEITPSIDAASGETDARTLLELGAVQAELNEFEAAESSYLLGIGGLIEQEGEFSPVLIAPYRELADVYIRSGRHADAITVLLHAQHVSQRSFGLFNTEQMELLDELSRVHETAGDTRAAQRVQRERLEIASRRYGEESPEIVPFYYELAEYYELSRMRAEARDLYEVALGIQQDHYGPLAAELMKPIRELVRLDILSAENTSARRRLREMLEVTTDIPALERAESLAVLGDWELALGRLELAQTYYRDAYVALAVESEAGATAYFTNPKLINFVPPPSPVDRARRGGPYEWGSIVVDFSLSADGRAEDVTVVSSSPAGLMDARYRRRLLESYFRPRVVAGESAPTPRIRFSHSFRYFLPD